MRNSLAARSAVTTAVLALVVVAVFTAFFFTVADLRTAAQDAERADQVIASADRLERLLVEIQNGPRGYIIGGREEFLEPWRAARRELPREAAVLQSLIGDEGQRSLARQIVVAMERYVAEYAVPLVRTARSDRAAAAAIVARGEGKRRSDAIHALFDRFQRREAAIDAERDARADEAVRRAVFIGAAGVVLAVLLIVVYTIDFTRTIVTPIRRLADAAERIAGGDLSARVGPGGRAELRSLGRAFDEMASSLDAAREEMERQNAELEAQTVELEDNQARLEAANEELEQRRVELERAFGALGEEKKRLDFFLDYGDRLAREVDAEAVADVILSALGDCARAEVGTLFVLADEDELSLAASRGLTRASLPERLPIDAGLRGRALAERRVVTAEYGASGLRLDVLGEQLAPRHELNVPLVHGDRPIGVLTLGRVGDDSFSAEELEAMERLAVSGAVALANANSFAEAVRLANVNRAVLDATTDAIRLVDREGRTLLMNHAMRALSTDLLELSGRGTLYDQTRELAARTTDPAAYLERISEIAGDPELEAVDEYELVSGRSYSRYTAPVRDATGALLGRIFVLRETTSERQAERLKDELVATVSHELRTPLTGVLGFSELLLNPELDEATRATYLKTIHDEALRLNALINDFLDLQRIEAGHFTLALEPFDLAELVRQQARLFSAQSAEHTIDVDIRDEPLIVVGERDRMAQVLANLLSNAIKYSPEGGTVRMNARIADGSVRVEVVDEGLGIPQGQQARIFDKFFRVDSSDTRRIGGTGLGLALTKEIVEAHAGRVGFDSVEGRGSTFWVELPSARARATRRDARVLIVEDDPAAAALLAALVSEEGLAAEVVGDGAAALARAQADPPALVCLDIGLDGDLDGWDVLVRLKAAPATAGVPVIVCTAGNGRDEAAALGAADFVTKPFTPQRLRDAVARVLPTGGASVLVVDDDPTMRRLVSESLRGDSLRIREAADGEAALAAVSAEVPDAILLDLMMPGLDGFAVLERLQQRPEHRRVPVIVLTSKQLTREERRSLSRQAAAVLEKSAYSARELRRLIANAVGGEV